MSAFSLRHAWPQICDYSVSLTIPPSRWKMPWSTHERSAKRLYNAIRLQRPRRILETGTFEGLGTWIMAKALHENGGGEIITVDYDGDPELRIGKEDWASLDAIRYENLELARRSFPSVRVDFVRGDSRQVLPEIFPSQWGWWDLFFQDSMHFTAGILAEWKIVKPFAAPLAVAVFDDVCTDWRKLPAHLSGRADFCLGFILREGLTGRWSHRATAEGRAQFWTQRKT